MDDLKVKKEKVIKEFREELKLKNVENDIRNDFDLVFFKILNHIYKHSFREIKVNITRFKSLSFILIRKKTYIYIEYNPNQKNNILLSITNFNNNEDIGGIYSLNIDTLLKKIDELWTTNQ